MDRLQAPLDGLLHLMDRQVVDADRLMVCKCDDLELEERDDGVLVVTALLVGVPVWVPRLGRWFEEGWRRLGAARSDQQQPYRIDLSHVERVTQEIRLRGDRTGVLVRQDQDRTSVRHLVGGLLGADVVGPRGERLGNVLDVRLAPSGDSAHTVLVLTDLLVGRGRPGSYLGYDRSGDQGPALVRWLVRWLHRDSGMVAASDITSIDWESRVVHAGTGLHDLTNVGTTTEPGAP